MGRSGSTDRDVVIVDAVRTPVGRGHPEKGIYRDVHANELLGTCFTAVLERTGLPAEEVDDVLVGCVEQLGEQSINVGRNAWLQAGLPIEVPATTIDRQCGSGQQAVNFAASQIRTGANDIVVAGGVEHLGHVPMSTEGRWEDEIGTPWPPALRERHDLVPQGLSAELIAERWDIGRTELDEIALRSHRLAEEATAAGRFADEMVPVPGAPADRDQGIRPGTDMEALAGLKPAFKPDGRVTAGNSSQISDGAAAVLLMAREVAEAHGLRPLARVVDQVTVGVDPVLMLTGPVPATRRLLERNGLTVGDIGRYEVNEAFASVVAMWQREIEADPDRVNVNGGSIAIGHPLGSTGARLITSLAHELRRADVELGVVTMCCRGGIGTGTLLQRVDA
jgi:acetyl-CoA acetyltransferase family protein